MLKKVAYTLYPTTDMTRAKEFYENALGLAPGLADRQGDMYWIEYDLPGGGCLAISNAGPTEPSSSAGGTIAFEVEDLDALIEDLREKGVSFTGEMIHGPNCRMMVCLDPDDNSLLLHQLTSD